MASTFSNARALSSIPLSSFRIPLPFSSTSENQIEHCGCHDIASLQVEADANVAGQLAKRDIPVSWWRKQMLGNWMLARPIEYPRLTPREDGRPRVLWIG
jgi:hypothetical protein